MIVVDDIMAAAASAAFAGVLWPIASRAARRRGVTLRASAWPALTAGLATACAAVNASAPRSALFAAIAGASVCAVTDWETGLIFDDVTAATLFVTLCTALACGTLGAAIAGAFAVVCVLGALHTATRGAGLGLGDVKLGASIGAGLGALDGVASVGVAFVLGGTYGAALLVSGRARRDSSVRFGPFLAAGLVVLGIYPCCR